MNFNPSYHFSEAQLEEELKQIEAAKQNPADFEVLYKNYYSQILRFVFQRVENHHIAADLTSQVFLKAMLNLKKYKFQGLPFASWLYRIALNEVRLHFRKGKAEHVINISTEHLEKIREVIDDREEGELRSGILIKAIGELSDEDVEILELRYFEKRSFKEVGEILDITENNAKVRTYRVLDKLRAAMLPQKQQL